MVFPAPGLAARPSYLLQAALIVGVAVVGVLMGLLLGGGQVILAGMLSAPVLLPMGLLLLVALLGWRSDVFLWALVLSMFGTLQMPSLLKSVLSAADSALLLLAVPFVAAAYLQFRSLSRHATLLVAILLAFYLVGVLSSITGRSRFTPAVYTALMVVKPLALIGLGAALAWRARTERVFEWIVTWVWVPLVGLSLLQWFAPSAYGLLFSNTESYYDPNPFFPGMARARGPFSHPGVMATIAGVFAVFNIGYAVLDRKRVGFRLLVGLAYLLALAMSGQRQEFASTLVILPLVYVLARWRPGFLGLALVTAVSLVLVGLLVYVIIPESLERELQNWGLIAGGYAQPSTRAILYADSVRLANQHWPLGTGFGTFASAGSVRFDQSLFVEMGYGAFWWYKTRSFLYDSFWSRYIAETGWFGFGLQLLFYATVLHAMMKWLRERAVAGDPVLFRRAVLAISGLLLILVTSPTSSALSEPSESMFALIYIGVAWRGIVAKRTQVAGPTRQVSGGEHAAQHLQRQSGMGQQDLQART